MSLRAWLRESCTDSRGRVEPKMILGIPAVLAGILIGLAGLVQLIPAFDWKGWAIYMAFGGGLIGVTAVTDAINDKCSPEAGPPSPPAGA